MTKQKYGALTSSQDPNEIANRVKGAVLASGSFIMLIGAYTGASWIPQSVEQVAILAGQLGVAAGALWSLYGFGLWLISLFTKKTE